jgi:phage tail-like protein
MAINSIDDRGTIISDPLRTFRFKATFEAVGGSSFNSKITSFTGGFSNIEGLSIITQAVPYREGGYNTTTHFVPGMTTFLPLTFRRGALFGNDEAITWMKGLFAASAGDGFAVDTTGKNDATANFRCNVTIEVMDHPNGTASNVTKMRFKAKNAWISGLAYSDLSAGESGLLFETMQLQHEGLSVEFVNPPA